MVTITVRFSLSDVDHKLLATYMITKGIKYTKDAVQTIVVEHLHQLDEELRA